MRTIPSGFKDAKITDLQVCWTVTRRDGTVIRGTEADIDITITDDSRGLAGTYLKQTGITGSDIRSTDDLSVDNLEVKGALAPPTGDSSSDSSALSLTDLSGDDIEAGLYDNAEISTFLVNSLDPDLYQHILRTGWMGNIRRDSDQRYTTEMRGLTQALSQGIVKTYGIGCQWELGSTPSTTPPGLCRVDLTPFITSGAMTVATSRREFQIGVGEIPFAPNVIGGKITWTSGYNVLYSMEIKGFISLVVTLFLPMPNDITVGDTFDFQPGCNKTVPMCVDTYNNIDNYGGWGKFVPGQSEILKVGKR